MTGYSSHVPGDIFHSESENIIGEASGLLLLPDGVFFLVSVFLKDFLIFVTLLCGSNAGQKLLAMRNAYCTYRTDDISSISNVNHTKDVLV